MSVEILRPSKCSAQGKTTRKQSAPMNVALKKVDVPNTIIQFHNDVELSADVMHFNDEPFLTSISEGT